MKQSTTGPKYGWRIPEWAEAVGIGRSSTCELIAQGKIRSVKFGGARIITTHPEEFLASLAEADVGCETTGGDDL